MAEVLIAATLLSTGKQLYDQRKLGKIEEKKATAQQNMERVTAKRQQVQQLARMRSIRAQMANTAEQTGTGNSSTLAGGTGAIASAAAENIQYLQQGVVAANTIFDLNKQSIDTQQSAELFGAIAKVGDAFATATGAYEDVWGDITGSASVPDSQAQMDIPRDVFSND